MSLVPIFAPVASLYNLGAASYDSEYTIVGQQTPTAFVWNGDGTKFFTSGYDTSTVLEFSVSTPYRIDGASQIGGIAGIANGSSNAYCLSLFFNDDGTKIFATRAATFWATATLEEFDLSSPYGGTATYVQGASGYAGAFGMRFSDDGAFLFYVAGSSVYRDTLATNYDPFSVSSTQTLNLSTDFTAVYGVSFGKSGRRMIVSGDSSGGVIKEYSLSSAYTLSSPNLTGATYSTVSEVSSLPRASGFDPTGKKLFVMGQTGGGSGTDNNGDPKSFGAVHQYSTVG